MTCAGCGSENFATAKFCVDCGTALTPASCPSCGTPAVRGRFCAECGTALNTPGIAAEAADTPSRPGTDRPRVAERRLVSVLFGDLVGFTALSETRDPEEVRELLSRYFEAARTVVERYGGTVEKFIGDAVMAVWGVPTAHEDDAERAVRAGLDLVDRVAGLAEEVDVTDLAMRVGIVTGEVAVTLGATGEGMVAGDVVNTAARVQAAADPGSVWVEEMTRSLTAAAVAYADAGTHLLKGKAVPLQLHHARAVVAAVGGVQRVDGLEAPFTGRDRELRLVKELFEATVEDGRSRLVLVSGVAGIGKSRLGWEFEKYVDGLRAVVRWHRGRCLSYGEGVAFWALAEMVRGRLDLSEGDTEDVLVDRLEIGLRELVRDEHERSWLRPSLSVLLGTQTRVLAREDMFAGWSLFFERVCVGASAVVMLVEDLQYADDGLLDFLEHLVETARFPLFVLGLTRPDLADRRPSFGTGRRANVIHLEPLGDQAMQRLVDGLVAGLPDPARAALVERAEGIPLYAVETVRALIDRDAVVPREGRYVLADDAAERIDATKLDAPPSLHALVSSRLDALSPDERTLVQDAAVLGMSFSRRALAALRADGADDLDAQLATLVRKEIVELQTDPFSPERGQYRFVQAVVRQVAYDTLSRRDRKSRHLAVARFLSTEPDPGDDLAAVIAQHLLDAISSSGTGDDDVAATTDEAQALLERAAIRARTLGSPAEAYRHYVAALRLPASDDRRARLDEGAARAALALGDPKTAAGHAQAATQAHDAAGRVVDAARTAAVVGQSLVLRQEHAAAIRELTPRYDALSAETGVDEVVLDLAETLGLAHNYSGEVDTARGYVERMLLLAEAMGDTERVVTALAYWSNIWIVNGIPTAALAVLNRAVELARTLQRPAALLRPLINTAAFNGTRDLRVALAAAEEALRLAEQTGNRPIASLAAANLMSFLWTSGRWVELQELLASGSIDHDDRSMQASQHAVARWLAVARGESVEPLPEGVTELDRSDDLQARAWSLTARAAGLFAPEEQAERAALSADACRAAFAWSGTDDDFVHHWVVALESSITAGDDDLTDELLDLVESRPPGLVTPYVHAELLRLRGLASYDAGKPEAADADLRRAIEELHAFGAPFRRAQAELALGRLLRAQGDLAEGEALLSRAKETFASLGAASWVDQVDLEQSTRV